jgi:hypothetical protein
VPATGDVDRAHFSQNTREMGHFSIAFVIVRFGKSESSKSSRNGQQEIEEHKQKAERRECFSAQVSVQRTDANLGHQARRRIGSAPAGERAFCRPIHQPVNALTGSLYSPGKMGADTHSARAASARGPPFTSIAFSALPSWRRMNPSGDLTYYGVWVWFLSDSSTCVFLSEWNPEFVSSPEKLPSATPALL